MIEGFYVRFIRCLLIILASSVVLVSSEGPYAYYQGTTVTHTELHDAIREQVAAHPYFVCVTHLFTLDPAILIDKVNVAIAMVEECNHWSDPLDLIESDFDSVPN